MKPDYTDKLEVLKLSLRNNLYKSARQITLYDLKNPNATSKINGGYGIIHILTVHAKKQLLSEFIKKRNPNINLQDKNGDTSLHLAVRMGDLQKTKLLLSNSANPHIQNTTGKTPLENAIFEGNTNVTVEILRKNHFSKKELEIISKEIELEILTLKNIKNKIKLKISKL